MFRISFGVIFLFSLCPVFGQNATDLVDAYLVSKSELVSTDYEIIKDFVSSTSKVRHIHFNQRIHDLPIEGTTSSIHIVNGNERVYERLAFIASEVKVENNSSQLITPQIAVKKIIGFLGLAQKGTIRMLDSDRANTSFTANVSGVFEEDIRLNLCYLPQDGVLIPAWKVFLYEVGYKGAWEFLVNAKDGTLLEQHNRMDSCFGGSSKEESLNYNANLYDIPDYNSNLEVGVSNCENCYEVFSLPLESPYDGAREIVEFPANTLASPYGWHDTDGQVGNESNATTGNNTDVIDGDDRYGYQASGGENLDFSNFPFDTEYTEENQYEDAALTNLFYVFNRVHDILYRYGFDEGSGNFQFNNYDNGGKGEDLFRVRAQTTARPCNAVAVINEDGISPVAILNLCGDKDGSYDNAVNIHEYTHGLTSRLTIGNTNLSNDENPKEGWSDWYALMLTMKEGDRPETPRTIGRYTVNQPSSGGGVREFPYSTQMDINPLTFSDLNEDMGIHEVGTVWASILWEMSWVLIEQYGFDSNFDNYTGELGVDAGNIMALAIVTEALNFTYDLTGFVDARNAIQLAAILLYGPGIECSLWEPFTRRGLGVNADSGSPSQLDDQIASFDSSQILPRFDLEFDGLCNSSDNFNYLVGGYPLGGRYEGPGVVDGGNGISFAFHPSEAGIGTHTLYYYIPETPCFEDTPERISVEVEIEQDTEPPVINCLQNKQVELSSLSNYIVPEFYENVDARDLCSGKESLVFTQIPAPGTAIFEGEIQVVIEVADPNDNKSSCSFLLKIDRAYENELVLLPNPTLGGVVIQNPLGLKVDDIEITDITGKSFSRKYVGSDEKTIPFSIEQLASGVYIVVIRFEGTLGVYKVVKE